MQQLVGGLNRVVVVVVVVVVGSFGERAEGLPSPPPAFRLCCSCSISSHSFVAWEGASVFTPSRDVCKLFGL